MKQALGLLRTLRREAVLTGSDYNRGFHAALDELEERFLDTMWDQGEDDDATV